MSSIRLRRTCLFIGSLCPPITTILKPRRDFILFCTFFLHVSRRLKDSVEGEKRVICVHFSTCQFLHAPCHRLPAVMFPLWALRYPVAQTEVGFWVKYIFWGFSQKIYQTAKVNVPSVNGGLLHTSNQGLYASRRFQQNRWPGIHSVFPCSSTVSLGKTRGCGVVADTSQWHRRTLKIFNFRAVATRKPTESWMHLLLTRGRLFDPGNEKSIRFSQPCNWHCAVDGWARGNSLVS